MTGGTALPADFSPPPVPGTPDQPGDTGQPGGSGQSGGSGQPGSSGQPGGNGRSDAGASNGRDQAGRLPRPFFAAQPEDAGPYGQPASQSQPHQHAPSPNQPFGQPANPNRPGQPPNPNQPYGQPGNFPGGPASRTSPPQRQPRQRPTRRPERELRHRAIAALVFGALSLVALLGIGADLHRGVYVLLFSAAVGIAGAVIGITALVKARKTGSYRPRGAIAGIVLGALAALISIPILVTYLAYPTQVDNYVKCLSQVQATGGSAQACVNQFYKSIQRGTSGSGQVGRSA